MTNIEKILIRVSEVVGTTKPKYIAHALDVSGSTLSNWKSRQTIPYETLHQFAIKHKISFGWLIEGEPQKGDYEKLTDPERERYEKHIERLERYIDRLEMMLDGRTEERRRRPMEDDGTTLLGQNNQK